MSLACIVSPGVMPTLLDPIPLLWRRPTPVALIIFPPTAPQCVPSPVLLASLQGMDPTLFGGGPPNIGGRKANLSPDIQMWAEEVGGVGGSTGLGHWGGVWRRRGGLTGHTRRAAALGPGVQVWAEEVGE